jgi:hypothetical protein
MNIMQGAFIKITGRGEDRKPSSVPRPGYPLRGDDHSSGTAVACCL